MDCDLIMTAAPLGQAYLIPYKNKGQLEAQFQLGYRGLIALAHRNGVTVTAHAVHERDEFSFIDGETVEEARAYGELSEE